MAMRRRAIYVVKAAFIDNDCMFVYRHRATTYDKITKFSTIFRPVGSYTHNKILNKRINVYVFHER